MKRFLSILLALFMIAACALTMVACDKKDEDEKEPKENLEVDAPAGCVAWSNEDIGFAYPSDWTETDMPPALFVAQSLVGNNVAVMSEAKNGLYATVTNENFMTVLAPSYQMTGANISNPTVGRVQSANGVEIIKLSFKNTMAVSGVSVTVWQTQYCVDVGNKTYVVCVTGRTQSEMLEIVRTIEPTLVAAK